MKPNQRDLESALGELKLALDDERRQKQLVIDTGKEIIATLKAENEALREREAKLMAVVEAARTFANEFKVRFLLDALEDFDATAKGGGDER